MPVIALLTDFSLSDHYVGTMKGVILSTNPNVTIIDISHEVAPQNILQAAYLLWASYRSFPPKTIFVTVVDPGVGSRRKIIAVETRNQTFLAPDNGVLDFVLQEEEAYYGVEIKVRGNSIVGLPGVTVGDVSSTFHGRDIFAPIAAALSMGRKWNDDAPRIQIRKPSSPFFESGSSRVIPHVLHIDRFGNIVTNIRSRNLEEAREMVRSLHVGRKRVSDWIPNYESGKEGTPSLILGSSGLLEIVVKNGNAAATLSATFTSKIAVVRK